MEGKQVKYIHATIFHLQSHIDFSWIRLVPGFVRRVRSHKHYTTENKSFPFFVSKTSWNGNLEWSTFQENFDSTSVSLTSHNIFLAWKNLQLCEYILHKEVYDQKLKIFRQKKNWNFKLQGSDIFSLISTFSSVWDVEKIILQWQALSVSIFAEISTYSKRLIISWY